MAKLWQDAGCRLQVGAENQQLASFDYFDCCDGYKSSDAMRCFFCIFAYKIVGKEQP